LPLDKAQHLDPALGPKRILALDGGGIRGVLTLEYLEVIEALLRQRRNDSNLLLSDYFDLIGGTSTGSIIAAGLACGMPVADIKKLYTDLGATVFIPTGLGYVAAKFQAGPLQIALDRALGADTTVDSDKVRTGLMVMTKRLDTGSPWPLCYDAPTIAGALLYDFDNWGSSRPFIEAGGWLTPYESVHGSRVYPNGLTTASGSWTSVDRDLSLFVRAGWLARLTPIDEAAVYADIGRNWLQTGGYTETTTAINAFPLSAAPELQALNIARLGAQYTHLFADHIEVNVSGAIAHGFGGGTGGTVNVTDFGLFTASALPTTTWFEYGARVGYRFTDQMVLDAFVLGALGGEVHAAAHGGMALRVAF
jgi:hypothetical protein